MIPTFEDEMKLIKETREFLEKINNSQSEFCIEGLHFVFDPLECEIVKSCGNCSAHDKNYSKRMEDKYE